MDECTYRFVFSCNTCNFTFYKESYGPFARITLGNFVYATETWNYSYKMFVNSDELLLCDLATQHKDKFQVIVRRRPQTDIPQCDDASAITTTTTTSTTTSPNTHSKTSSPTMRTRTTPEKGKDPFRHVNEHRKSMAKNAPASRKNVLFFVKYVRRLDIELLTRISYECLYRTTDRKSEPTPYDSKWIIEFKPLEVIYVPEVFQNLIDFVSFMEEHKNLRRTVQDLQTSVTGYLKVSRQILMRN